MKINRTTAIVLGVALAVLYGLAGWGHLTGLDPDMLDKVRTGAEAVSVFALAFCGRLLTKDDDGDGVPDVIQRFLGLTFLLAIARVRWAFLAVALAGCGAGAVQTATSAQATVLVATQPARVAFYEAEAARCETASPDFPAWERCMLPAEGVQRAADAYRDGLSAAQAAIRLGDGGPAIACLAALAGNLVSASEAAGAPIPSEVREIAALAAQVGEGCSHAE